MQKIRKTVHGKVKTLKYSDWHCNEILSSSLQLAKTQMHMDEVRWCTVSAVVWEKQTPSHTDDGM